MMPGDFIIFQNNVKNLWKFTFVHHIEKLDDKKAG